MLPPAEYLLSQVELLQAMYPTDLTIHESSLTTYNNLLEGKETSQLVRLVLCVNPYMLNIDILDPLRISLQRHNLSRKAFDVVSAALPIELDDAIEYLRSLEIEPVIEVEEKQVKKLERVWLYFPSLSSRSKRDDLVKFAADHEITGFVLAGKPGVLCLEGSAYDVQAYLADIKTNSWSDIPPFQKKVTERWRESDISRQFQAMEEITEDINRHGQRGNRGDLGQVEAWLNMRNLGYAFHQVFRLTLDGASAKN